MGKWYWIWGQILVRHMQQIRVTVLSLPPSLELFLIHFLSLSLLFLSLRSEIFLWEVNPFSLFRHFTLLSTMLLLGFYSGCCDQTILFTNSLAALLFMSTPLKHTNCQHWLCRLHIANRHLPPRDFPSLALQEICMRKAAWKCFLQKKTPVLGFEYKTIQLPMDA